MKQSDLFFNVLRLPVDFTMLLVAGIATYFLRTELLSAFRPVLFEFNLPLLRYVYLVIFVSLLFIGAFAISGLYSMKARLGIGEELSRLLVASSAGIMTVIIYIFLRQELFDSRFLVLGGWFFAVVFVFVGRMIIRWLQSVAVSKYSFGVHKLILIGANDISDKIALEIKNDSSSGYRIVKQIPRFDLEEVGLAITTLGADEVILADPNFPTAEIDDLINVCHEKHVVFKFIPASQMFTSNFDLNIFKGLPLVEIKRTNLDGWGRVIKRIIDVVGSLIGLIILFPLFGFMALAIKWETEGPVFARLKRVSKNKEFFLYKFRGMISVDADGGSESLKAFLVTFNERKDGPLFKIKNDPRITNVGRVIRKYRLDELAQFINILKGDMSLVGPRPHQPDEISNYQKHHKKVLAIKAGATGLAQVSGSSDLDFEKEVALDSFYIDNWSLWLDFKIVLKTALKMFFDRSAV